MFREGLGCCTPNSRSYLTHFTQPDSIVPDQIQGVQAWDRYAYANNNPILHNDPTGHCVDGISTMVCAAVIGGLVSGVYNYASQVYDNLDSGDDWQTALTSVDAKQIAVAAAGGAVAGATMVFVGTALATYTALGVAGSFIAGAAANTAAGQYEAVLSSGIDQALDVEAGQSFDKAEFGQVAANNGFLQGDVMLADAASGAVVGGLTQVGLNQVLGPSLHPKIRMTPSREALLDARGFVTGFGASGARGFSNFADEIILRGIREVENPYILDQDK